MKRMLTIAAATAALTATAASAQAAQVQLALDLGGSSIPARSAFKMPNGQIAFQAPYTGLKFKAVVTNDAGAPVLKADGRTAYASVDLIARTPSGDKVMGSQTIWDGEPLTFSTVYLQENTTYFARVNPSPEGGVAAPTDSNAIPVKAYLKNYPGASYSSYRRNSHIWGFYSKSSVKARSAVRVLIQQKVGSRWKTVRTLTPNAANRYDVRVRVGRTPAAFRVRTVPVKPNRFVAINEYWHCVAPTTAKANRMCKAIGGSPFGK